MPSLADTERAVKSLRRHLEENIRCKNLLNGLPFVTITEVIYFMKFGLDNNLQK